MAYCNQKMKTIMVAIMNNIYFKITLGEKNVFSQIWLSEYMM